MAKSARRQQLEAVATYPLDWTVAIPTLGISLSLHPLLDDQELVTRESTRVTYWEGAVSVNGSFSPSKPAAICSG